MANVNDFTGEATQFNQGWYNSEKTNRGAQREKAKQQLDQVDPYYETLFEDLGANQNKAMNGLQASMARRGLTRSGIRTRAEGNLLGEYGKLNSKLTTEKTNRKNELTTNFNTADKLLGDLDSEFQSKVAQTARELFNTWQQNETARLAATSSSTGGGGAGAGDGSNPYDTKLWADADAYAKSGRHFTTNDTENVFIPEMISKYQRLGFDPEYIKEVIYTARKPYEGKGSSISGGAANTGVTYDSYGREWKGGKLTGNVKRGNTVRAGKKGFLGFGSEL